MKSRASFAAGRKLTLLAVPLALMLSAGVSQADKGQPWWGWIEVVNIGDEPQASGVMALTNVRSVRPYWPWGFPPPGPIYAFKGDLAVKCYNLQPGATYSTPVGDFRADSSGTGKVRGKFFFEFMDYNWLPVEVHVDRLDPDGSRVTVLVGYITWD